MAVGEAGARRRIGEIASEVREEARKGKKQVDAPFFQLHVHRQHAAVVERPIGSRLADEVVRVAF